MTWAPGTNETQPPNPRTFSLLDDPGNVLPPAIFEPDSTFTNGVAQLWLSASGGVHWGGAVVQLSLDGVNYHPIGSIENPARQGVLQRALPSHADPDATDVLAIDLSPSRGILDLDVTHDDADFVRSLCWICSAFGSDAPCDGELLSYGTAAALTHNHHYQLTYLRRGRYGSTISAHPIGSYFTRIDTVASVGGDTLTLLRYDLPAGYVGVVLYLKFLSFNRFGQSLQDLADVVEYTFTPCGVGHGTGPFGVPKIPTGFNCSALVGDASTGAILLSWDPNPVADNVSKYEIYRASGLGAPFSSATLVGTTTSTSWIDAALVVGTSWTHFVEACNIIGCSDPTAGCDATVGSAIDDDTCDMQDIYSGTSV